MEVAIANDDAACVAAICQSLEGALASASTQEEIDATQECIDRLLSRVSKLSGGTVLHFVAEKVPHLRDVIFNLSSNLEALLNIKDRKGLLPVHHNKNLGVFYGPLCKQKYGVSVAELTASQMSDLEESVVLHRKIADGDKSVLERLFLEDESNVYKRIDTVDGAKSILEVAAESGNSDLVKFILLEHRKLQEKSKTQCEELKAEVEKITALQIPEMQAMVSDLEAKRVLQEGVQRARSDSMCSHANATVLRVLSVQEQQGWHQDVLDSADLREETLVAALLDNGINPLVTAVQSGNSAVAQKILSETKGCVNDDLKDKLIEKQDVAGLLKYGFGSAVLYDAEYSLTRDLGKYKAEFDPSAATVALVREEMNILRKQVTSKFANKGALLTYAHAISMDTSEADNIRDKLSGFEDGDKALVSVCSPDGHNIGTLIAAFGSIAQWQAYANKYSKLKAADSGGVSPAVNVSAEVGSPLQVALLAKHFANSATEKRRRAFFFDYLVQHYLDDLFIPNVNGENLLHTAVRCKDAEAMESILTHAASVSTLTFSALNQRNGAGRTVLELAVYMNNASVIKAILATVLAHHGADAATSLLLRSRLLHTAVAMNNDAMLKLIAGMQKMLNAITAPEQVLLLENQKDSQDRDPFVLAVEMGNLSAVRVMQNAGLQMNVESVKKAILALPASFDQNELKGFIKCLKLSKEDAGTLLTERERHLREALPSKSTPAVEVKSDKEREEIVAQVRHYAESESKLFKKRSCHTHNSVLSEFQQGYNERAASLKDDITSGRVDAAIASVRSHPGLIDSSDERNEIVNAILRSKNVQLAKIAVQSSNKFIRNSNGDNLLDCIIKGASDETLRELVTECMVTGYGIAEVSGQGTTSFQLLEARNPVLAAELRSTYEEENAKTGALMRCLEDVLQSANVGEKSRAASLLLGEMNSLPKGYHFPVFSQMFSQISSESVPGEHSLLTKRFGLLCYLLKGVSYFGERNPENGDTVLHMLFKVLRTAPSATTEVHDALSAILANKHFSPELLLEKNYYGVSALDVLAGTKGSGQLLTIIRQAVPSFADKISFSRMLMLSVLGADSVETREFLEHHQGPLLDINAEDEDGYSSLECAILNNNIPMCKLLLEYGAEINTVDSCGRNFLDKILDRSLETGSRPSPEMVSFLVSRGIDLIHSSGGLSTLERFEKFERKRDLCRARLAVLMNKTDLCQSDYTELRFLMNAQLENNYCQTLLQAELERERVNKEVSEQVASALYTASDNILIRNVRSLVSAPFRLSKEKSTASIVGGLLCVKIDGNATVDTDQLFSSAKSNGIRCSSLSFNNGRNIVKVERRADGLTNYIPQSGCVVVSVEAAIKGSYKTVDILMSSDGSVSFGSKKNADKYASLLREGKLDLSSSGVYVNGTPLEKAIGSASQKPIASQGIHEAAKALKEAGASSAEDVHAHQGQVPTGGTQHAAERGSDI
ncbi:ankyrin repeat domain-containing protein [Neorickettsia findlayensis]|uniref:Ankyrin repeat domain-containing protein n=1 Tax=Neorickettsia findlayensis TaxID=2686014 RepID=A0A6P1GCW0_9RICK|nr:ankyrin repeat domain-containing protein [Neorickettsia findlayensis]